jgi:phenylalanyl-tRNA synthetase beta chain
MASVSFPRKQFEKDIGKLDEKMQERIALFGTPLEKFDDREIEVEVFPNRPDLLSYHGYKRAFLAFLNRHKGLKQYKLNKPDKNYKVIIDSSVKPVRPYTACAIVKGLKFDDEKIKEIIDIQEKLHLTVGRKRKKFAIGIYPLEKINLPITFKAVELDKIKFIPLESDREMSGLQILQKHPAGKEYSHLLAGKAKAPVFSDANNSILSMPPIINSHLTGKVTIETQDIFVECSGADFSILSQCLNIIITALAEMGGKIFQMELAEGKKKTITPDLTPEKMKINLNNVNALLGLNFNEKQIKEHLERMGYDYSKGIVEIPRYRMDIMHEVDLIEDIAISYGYEKFIPEIPEIATIGQESMEEIIKRKFAEILSGLGMSEVMNYHLTSKENQFSKMMLPAENLIEISKSKTDYTVLRKDLAHYLLKNLSENVDAEYPQRIFEIGRVFLSEETENLALALAPSNFTEIRQILEALFRMLDIEIKFQEPVKKISYLIEGRTAEIKLENKTIGHIGEVHPKILKNWKIKMPVSVFEINLEELFRKLE